MGIAWPPELVDALARRRAVVVFGSGISRQSRTDEGERPKSWTEFLEAGADELQEGDIKRRVGRLIKRRDFLTACQVLKDEIGRQRFNSLLREEFWSRRFNPAPIHDSIIRLDARVFATPNFDGIFEARWNTLGQHALVTKKFDARDIAEVLRGDVTVLIKMHGGADAPGGVIFTRQDYAQARQEHRGFYAMLEALVITHTFLFLGCGLDDPDIRLVLEDYAFTYEFTAPHYFVLPRNHAYQRLERAVSNSLNIEILTYDQRREHAQLKTSLDELGQAVEERRLELRKLGAW